MFPSDVLIALFGLIAAIGGAAMTGLVTYKLGLRKAQAESLSAEAQTQKSMNEAFGILVQAFRDDREEMRRDMREIKEELQLITTHVTNLEKELIKNGHIVPPRPSRPRVAVQASGQL